MFDLGWAELLVIGVVALIVVGPKDLPILFRKAGEFVGRMRGMAREFSQAMNDAADESGMRETAKSLRSITDPKQMGLDGINDAVEDFKKWDPDSETAKLAEERREAKRKIQEATANAQAKKQAAEVQKAHAEREAAEAAKQKAAAEKSPDKTVPAKKAPPKAEAAKKKPAAKTKGKTAASGDKT